MDFPKPETTPPPYHSTEASSSQPQSPPQIGPSGIEFVRDAEYLIESFLPAYAPPTAPPTYARSALPMPFCTPQIAVKFDSAFARGYNFELQNAVGISQEEFLQFIDGLNLAMTASPPLRVVNTVGMAIGFVYVEPTTLNFDLTLEQPFHWAMIAGTVIQTTAQIGMHVLSKTLTDRYLRAANQRLFKPKGLVVRLCTTAAMEHLVMHSGTGKGPSALSKIGRGVGTVLLHAPLPFSSRIVRAIADKPPTVHASISSVGDGRSMPLSTQRRLASLDGHALHVDLDVPPPAKVSGVMDTMASWGVAFDAYRNRRKEDRVEQRRRELERVNYQLQAIGMSPRPANAPVAAPMSYMEMELMGRKERKHLRKAAKRARRRERGRNGLLSGVIGPKETKLERKVANANLLEHWGTGQVVWLVVMNADLDSEIEGIERADSMDNEEHVDQQAWQAEMVRERDQLEEEEDSSDEEDEEHHHHN
ncbi:unnamed protein product [Mycena citricolor]|uniref:Uncharacterized protein n=1 Tax=Mycena citricolor TaxID=2018698 RepID=A0AAD2I0W7_9AGAR|nr:unnamed protein product [Mycena citricolor]